MRNWLASTSMFTPICSNDGTTTALHEAIAHQDGAIARELWTHLTRSVNEATVSAAITAHGDSSVRTKPATKPCCYWHWRRPRSL